MPRFSVLLYSYQTCDDGPSQVYELEAESVQDAEHRVMDYVINNAEDCVMMTSEEAAGEFDRAELYVVGFAPVVI